MRLYNMKQYPQRFFARGDSESLGRLDEMFNSDGRYFYLIEHDGHIEWLDKNHKWTKSAIDSLNFKNKFKAMSYAVENKITGFVITEHEFVN